MAKVTKNFSYSELIYSDTAKLRGIENIPSKDIESVIDKCIYKLQELRDAGGDAIVISSGYRCSELNSAIGGSKTSNHMTGYAYDTIGVPFDRYVEFIKDYFKDKNFNQVIIESNKVGSKGVHIDFKETGKRQLFNMYT